MYWSKLGSSHASYWFGRFPLISSKPYVKLSIYMRKILYGILVFFSQDFAINCRSENFTGTVFSTWNMYQENVSCFKASRTHETHMRWSIIQQYDICIQHKQFMSSRTTDLTQIVCPPPWESHHRGSSLLVQDSQRAICTKWFNWKHHIWCWRLSNWGFHCGSSLGCLRRKKYRWHVWVSNSGWEHLCDRWFRSDDRWRRGCQYYSRWQRVKGMWWNWSRWCRRQSHNQRTGRASATTISLVEKPHTPCTAFRKMRCLVGVESYQGWRHRTLRYRGCQCNDLQQPHSASPLWCSCTLQQFPTLRKSPYFVGYRRQISDCTISNRCAKSPPSPCHMAVGSASRRRPWSCSAQCRFCSSRT